MKTRTGVLRLAASAAVFSCGAAAAGGESAAPATLLTVPSLELSLAQPGVESASHDSHAAPEQAVIGDADASIPFGRAGSNSLVLGLGAGTDGDIHTGELHAGYSHFLCDELEFSVELTGWYFDQNDDTGGVNPGFQFRWHALHAEDYSWTVFGEAGIGLLFAFDNFPDDGTGFNFSPRAGVGTTFRVTDDGLRLQLGVRWQHFSNGRIEGDGRNPGYDGIMAYVGFIIPLN